VVFAVTATGDENDTCCQPDADSPENVAVASSVPVDDHRFPTWVPELPTPLKKRTPVTYPSLSERNFTPNSTDPVSPVAATAGVAPADQIEHGHPLAATVVVNDHDTGAAITLPAVSSTPDTVAVYTPPLANGADGVNIAVPEPGLYELVPATTAFVASWSVNDTEPACTASENVAVGATAVGTPVAPMRGVLAVTVGAVVSGGVDVVVNDQDTGAVIALPATSSAPETEAVYTAPSSRADVGVNVAVCDAVP
jgi:hypothetical protein